MNDQSSSFPFLPSQVLYDAMLQKKIVSHAQEFLDVSSVCVWQELVTTSSLVLDPDEEGMLSDMRL